MTIFYFILLLSVIISLHEAGHLLAAKIFNVYCSEYAIGMGPKIFSLKGKETEYSLRLLPLGGFVAMAGDSENLLETNQESKQIPFERTLLGIAKWKKIIIMLAGIVMNFLLAWIIIAMLLLQSGTYSLPAGTIIEKVSENSAAAIAGMKDGDRIYSLTLEGGVSVYPKDFQDISTYFLGYEGNGTVRIEVERDGKILLLELTPQFQEERGQYVIGIQSGKGEVVSVNWLNAWTYSLDLCWRMIETMILSIAQLIRGIGVKNLSGPIGIYKATAEASNAGISAYLYMLALISLNIGFMNLLPLPILDGGRVFLMLVEAVVGKSIPKKVETLLMTVSTLLILLLFVYATFNDILRLL